MIVAHGTADFVVEGVELRAAGQMNHQETPPGLEQRGEVLQGIGLAAKVGKGMEAEDHVEPLRGGGGQADIPQLELRVDSPGTGLRQHAGGEIHGGNPARLHSIRQPGGDLPGTATHLQQILPRLQLEAVRQLVQPTERDGGIGAGLIPSGGVTVKESDAGVGGRLSHGHTCLYLRNTVAVVTLHCMNVTPLGGERQAACHRWLAPAVAALLLAGAAVQAESHLNLQAVNADGTSAWTPAFPFTLRGVLLCNPDEMLDFTPNLLPWNDGANAYRLGAEWQITFQAVGEGDRGGTTCWMGQSYGNMPWLHDTSLSYPNEAWVAEVLRLSYDPATLHPFRAGDLIEVTARQSLFYGGKRNLNEGHDIDPAYNFDLKLITANYGLPAPEVITLADVMQPGGVAEDRATWQPIFDATRATGGEHWQGMRVRVNDLTLVSTNGWNPASAWGARLSTATDGNNRFLSLRHPRYSLGAAPTAKFDAIGIFTQEGGNTNGYELFVQQVLPQAPAPEVAIGLNVTISWPVSAQTYQLEWRAQADTGEWATVTNAPAVIDGAKTVILAPGAAQRFYRLRQAP